VTAENLLLNGSKTSGNRKSTELIFDLKLFHPQENLELGQKREMPKKDLVSANQIIEHLVNVDRFASEIYRVLKPNGYLILSTENLSSWHNIFALILGWQAFSQHISQIKNIGNPFRLSNWEDIPAYYTHVKIFTPKGLKDLFKTHNFQIIDFFGASYYPFPPPLSSILGKIDPRHSPFIGIKARKPEVPK